MLKKLLSTMIACLLMQALVCVQPVAAKTKAEKQALFAQKVKAAIMKFGAGPDARVAIKLRDKTTVSGYIGQVGEDGFTVADLKTGTTTGVTYAEVAQAKGHNLSTGGKIAIGLGIAVAVLTFLLILENYG
jgi:hypothetical protein